VLVLPLVTLAAAFTYKLLVAPVIKAPEHNQIVVTLGLSLILQNAMLVFFTADLHAIPSCPVRTCRAFRQCVHPGRGLIASAVSIALCLGLYWFLRSTELGRQIRASAQDRDAALMCGVNVDRMYLLAFCIGVGSLGLVAPLIAPFNYVSPSVGSNFTLTAFIVVVLGSMGNFAGALIGGFIIGIVEAVGGLLTGGSINFIITYAIFILFLLFKPEGLLRRASAMKPMLLLALAVALLAGLAPLLSIYGQHIFVLVALYGSVALAWNILGGMAGQMSLGHALFVGAGRLCFHRALSKILRQSLDRARFRRRHRRRARRADGYTVFRRKLSGVYFALVTLALAEMALHIVSNVGFLGAANGLSIPSKPDFANFQFGSKLGFCYAALGILALVSGVILAIDRSRLGYVFLAIRENERAAAALGIDVVQGKVIAAAISGALAALVGPVYANYVLFIDPESVLGVPLSIDALLFSFVGGLGSLFGPLLGAIVLVPLTELLRSLLGGKLAGVHLIVYGVLLILVMRLAPQGLLGPADHRDRAEEEMSAPLLQVNQVSRWFGGLRAVDEVSFDLHGHEIVGLIGPNGAGKTTLVRNHFRLHSPDQGHHRLRRARYHRPAAASSWRGSASAAPFRSSSRFVTFRCWRTSLPGWSGRTRRSPIPGEPRWRY
jgi:ABC-type branched-subunit amino acid transport system permease subunit